MGLGLSKRADRAELWDGRRKGAWCIACGCLLATRADIPRRLAASPLNLADCVVQWNC